MRRILDTSCAHEAMPAGHWSHEPGSTLAHLKRGRVREVMQAGEGVPRESRELMRGPSPRTSLSSNRAMHRSRDGERSASTGMPTGLISWMGGLINGSEPRRSTAGAPGSFPLVGTKRVLKPPTNRYGPHSGWAALRGTAVPQLDKQR